MMINEDMAVTLVARYIKPLNIDMTKVCVIIKDRDNRHQAFRCEIDYNNKFVGFISVGYWYGDIKGYLSTPVHIIKERCI